MRQEQCQKEFIPSCGLALAAILPGIRQRNTFSLCRPGHCRCPDRRTGFYQSLPKCANLCRRKQPWANDDHIEGSINVESLISFRHSLGKDVRLQCCFLFPAARDSAAMLLMLLERGEDDCRHRVFFDTGWEFPAVCMSIWTNLKILLAENHARLQKPRLPVWALETEKTLLTGGFPKKPIRKRGTEHVHRIGCAWPNIFIPLIVQDVNKRLSIRTFSDYEPIENVKLPLRNCRGLHAPMK